MQVEVTQLTRRGAAVMRKSHTVTAETVRFGRGTDNEVQLSDIRVDLTAAALHQRQGGLYIDQLGQTPLRVGGQAVTAAPVMPGSEILIGPYSIKLTDPPEGCDAAISIELVQPLGDALQHLMAQSRLNLQNTHLSKRRTSWALFTVLLLLGLAIPIAVYFGGGVTGLKASVPSTALTAINMSWNPGELSNAHRFFAGDCASCHQGAFAAVSDASCLHCHADIGSHVHHASVDLGPAKQQLAETRCASCHEEHRGKNSLVIRENGLCVDCHRSLAETAPKTGILNVGDFPHGHPQFRVTVVADAAKPSFDRVALGGGTKPVDHPNLHFSHAAHLVPNGFPVLGYKAMVCADCHKPDAGGKGYLPITYKEECQSCHKLQFDTALPWKQVPHGDAAGVQGAIRDFYSQVALQGGSTDPKAPEFVRRAAGSPVEAPSDSQRPDVMAWVSQKTDAALAIVFDDKRGCAYCHVVSHAAAQGGGTPAAEPVAYQVAPVKMLTHFYPEARFDHSSHRAMGCAECHDARVSETSADVLVPGIETCVSCHGSETAALKAESTCTTCHGFHRQEFGPMREAVSAQQ